MAGKHYVIPKPAPKPRKSESAEWWPAPRKYLPTLADLIDRLTIVQMKAIFIPEHRDEYVAEIALIMHDIDAELTDLFRVHEFKLDAKAVHAVMMIMLTNHYIWTNESKARQGGSDQDKLLKLTHSINGVRNTAKNVLSALMEQRKDWKVDALAADLPTECGNWRVFSEE